MRRCIPFCLAFVLLVAVGCNTEPEPPPEPETPPEPPVSQIYQEMRQAAAALWRPPAGNVETLALEEIQPAIGAFMQVRAKYASMENGKQALAKFRGDVEELMTISRREQRWRTVKGCCDMWQTLEPGSNRFEANCKKADLMLARPAVNLRGFMEEGGETYAFLEIVDPKSNKIIHYQVREGDEFHKVCRLVEIIGGQQAVRLEYLPVNDEDWIVWGPSEKKGRNRRRLQQEQEEAGG